MYPENLSKFIQQFSRLPGVGAKSSERLGFYILSQPEEFARSLSESIIRLKMDSVFCSSCGNLSVMDPCGICTDKTRDDSIICVVEHPSDIYYIETTNCFHGLYHVLGGILSPLNGVSPEDLRINELIQRVKKLSVTEILFATSATTEGDTTALFIKNILQPTKIKFTHLARGIPVGTNLQYAGSGSLSQAIRSREEL